MPLRPPEHREHAQSVEGKLSSRIEDLAARLCQIEDLVGRVCELEENVRRLERGRKSSQTTRDSQNRLAAMASDRANEIQASQETAKAAGKATDVRVAALELAEGRRTPIPKGEP